MALYPRIYFARHTRHVVDPKRNRALSSHQAGVLDHLDEIQPTGLLALAAHMGVTASTMSLMIDRLARGKELRMKWVAIAVGILVVVVAAVAIIGVMLPKNHLASRSSHFRQPPQAIRDAITGAPDL